MIDIEIYVFGTLFLVFGVIYIIYEKAFKRLKSETESIDAQATGDYTEPRR